MRNSDAFGIAYSREVIEPLAFAEDTTLSTSSEHRKKRPSSTLSPGDSSFASTRSTVSSIALDYLSNPSSAIMGDFIPITISMADLKTAQPPKKGFVVMNSVNPDAQSVVMSGMAASEA